MRLWPKRRAWVVSGVKDSGFPKPGDGGCQMIFSTTSSWERTERAAQQIAGYLSAAGYKTTVEQREVPDGVEVNG